jgi:hypothetical protein
MMKFLPIVFATVALWALVAGPKTAKAATTLGTISVCYYSAECTYAGGVVDAPVFLFTNTSGAAITGARFAIIKSTKVSIVADKFALGTIKAGASAVIVTGLSDDKKTHPAGGFFAAIGEAKDTSDGGPNADTIVFTFSGKSGTAHVTSGKIKVSTSAGPSADGTVAHLNFLGGPANADGPCNDCFASTVVATLSVVPPSAPPAALIDGLSK